MIFLFMNQDSQIMEAFQQENKNEKEKLAFEAIAYDVTHQKVLKTNCTAGGFSKKRIYLPGISAASPQRILFRVVWKGLCKKYFYGASRQIIFW